MHGGTNERVNSSASKTGKGMYDDEQREDWHQEYPEAYCTCDGETNPESQTSWETVTNSAKDERPNKRRTTKGGNEETERERTMEHVFDIGWLHDRH